MTQDSSLKIQQTTCISIYLRLRPSAPRLIRRTPERGRAGRRGRKGARPRAASVCSPTYLPTYAVRMPVSTSGSLFIIYSNAAIRNESRNSDRARLFRSRTRTDTPDHARNEIDVWHVHARPRKTQVRRWFFLARTYLQVVQSSGCRSVRETTRHPSQPRHGPWAPCVRRCGGDRGRGVRRPEFRPRDDIDETAVGRRERGNGTSVQQSCSCVFLASWDLA